MLGPLHPAPAVLLDVLQGIPAAALVRLGPGEHFSQHAHVLLLQVRLLGCAGERVRVRGCGALCFLGL